MNTLTSDDLLPTLGARSARFEGGREYVAYPNLAGARWLLPADPTLRKVGLQLYMPQRLRGRLLKQAIASGALRGQRVWLDGTTMDELERVLGGHVGQTDARLAFSLGTPGANRKATAQVIGDDEAVLGYAKIAIGSLAQDAVDAEWRNLQRLSGAGPHGQVPKPIYVGTWRQARILLMTAGPATPGPLELGQPHVEFLRALHDTTRQECEFGSSAMLMRLRDALTRWGRVWPDPWPRRIALALRRLEGELGTLRVPLSFAHRDFAPWNTRSGPDGLFVFDWETAIDGVVPLYDAFHFGAIRAAAYSAPLRHPTSLRRLLAALWPASEGRLRQLYLAYLVDVSVLYGEARMMAPEVGEEHVWLWFGERIDECLATGSAVSPDTHS